MKENERIEIIEERINQLEREVEAIKEDLNNLYEKFEKHTHYIEISTTTESPD